MSEEQQAPQSQADDGGQAQEATQNEERAQETQTTETQEETEESVPKSELTKRNKEAQQLRRERNELKQKLDAHENEKLSEQQQQTKRMEGLESRISEYEDKERGWVEERRRARFAEQIKLPDPYLAYSALSNLDVPAEFDDSGNLVNANAVRKALKSYSPRVWGNGSADGGERGEVPSSNDMNSILRGATGRT